MFCSGSGISHCPEEPWLLLIWDGIRNQILVPPTGCYACSLLLGCHCFLPLSVQSKEIYIHISISLYTSSMCACMCEYMHIHKHIYIHIKLNMISYWCLQLIRCHMGHSSLLPISVSSHSNRETPGSCSLLSISLIGQSQHICTMVSELSSTPKRKNSVPMYSSFCVKSSSLHHFRISQLSIFSPPRPSVRLRLVCQSVFHPGITWPVVFAHTKVHSGKLHRFWQMSV